MEKTLGKQKALVQPAAGNVITCTDVMYLAVECQGN